MVNNDKERTCTNISKVYDKFICSECGLNMHIADHIGYLMSLDNKPVKNISFCPNCGCRVVTYEEE